MLAGYNNTSLDEDFVQRGSFPITVLGVTHNWTTTSTATPPVTTSYTDNKLVQANGTQNNTWTITIQFVTTEQFICLQTTVLV